MTNQTSSDRIPAERNTSGHQTHQPQTLPRRHHAQTCILGQERSGKAWSSVRRSRPRARSGPSVLAWPAAMITSPRGTPRPHLVKRSPPPRPPSRRRGCVRMASAMVTDEPGFSGEAMATEDGTGEPGAPSVLGWVGKWVGECPERAPPPDWQARPTPRRACRRRGGVARSAGADARTVGCGRREGGRRRRWRSRSWEGRRRGTGGPGGGRGGAGRRAALRRCTVRRAVLACVPYFSYFSYLPRLLYLSHLPRLLCSLCSLCSLCQLCLLCSLCSLCLLCLLCLPCLLTRAPHSERSHLQQSGPVHAARTPPSLHHALPGPSVRMHAACRMLSCPPWPVPRRAAGGRVALPCAVG